MNTQEDPSNLDFQSIANGAVSILNQGSQLSFTLVAASILEDQVFRTLQKVAPGFQNDPSKGSHGLRVHLLKGLGIITPKVDDALMSFANIRNAFAHKADRATYDDPDIAKHVKALNDALVAENEGSGFNAGSWSVMDALDKRFKELGVSSPLTHPSHGVIITGYIMLTFYLTWARHLASGPQTPMRINEIGKQAETAI